MTAELKRDEPQVGELWLRNFSHIAGPSGIQDVVCIRYKDGEGRWVVHDIDQPEYELFAYEADLVCKIAVPEMRDVRDDS